MKSPVVGHLGLSLVKQFECYNFSCPVIVEGAKDEMIAAFITIVMVADLYFISLYPKMNVCKYSLFGMRKVNMTFCENVILN